MKKILCLTAVISSLVLSKSLYAKSKSWPNLAYISQSFFEVSLGTEYEKSSNLKLRKWRKPIKILVKHHVGDKPLHDQLLNAHIQHLRDITTFNIKRVENKSDANLYYYFTKQSMLPDLVKHHLGKGAIKYLHGAVCLAYIKTNEQNYITSAHIFIPVDQARMHGKLVSCIVEELTQALGLVRDSDLVFPSIFNDNTKNALLTGLDEILLRLLSEKEVKAGMSQTQLQPVITKLLKEYQSKGLIETADTRVQAGKLYKMLGFSIKSKNSISIPIIRLTND